MTQPYVLSFVGENANAILQWWTEKILAGLERRGFSHCLINLREEGWQLKIDACLAVGKPEFCFSFQGMGANLRLRNGDNFWSRNAIPFLTYLGDNPYLAPGLHAAEGPGIYLLYSCVDFLQMYRDFLKGDAYSTLLKPGYPNNPLADHTPWNQREHPIVFVKTGIDSEAMRKSWIYFPKQVRSLIEDCAALVLTGVDRTIAALCSQVFAERQLHWGEQRELLLSTCSIVDRYVRAVWAERMVRALMRHDALVAGNWSHLDQSGSRARFWGPIPAGQLDALYAETKVLVNTTAGVRYGIQERIIAGMFAKAAVLSDTTPYLQDLLSDCRSFFGVTINETTFDEELDCTLNSILADPETAARVEATAAVAEKLFSFETFIQHLLEFVELEKYRCSVAAWGFPALSPRPIQ